MFLFGTSIAYIITIYSQNITPSTFAPDLTYFQEGSREAQEVSFLWPFSGLFSSTNILMEFDPDHYQPYLDSMVIAVEMYYDSLRKPPGYQAYPVHLDYFRPLL